MSCTVRCALALVCASAMASSSPAANVTPTKSGGDFIAGSGIPADNFTISTALTGESVALKGRLRDTGQPLSQSGNVYYVPAGLSVLSPPNPAWAFDYQFSPGTAGQTAESYLLTLQIDFDPGIGTTDYATIPLPVADADADPTNSWDDGDGFFLNPGSGAWSDDVTPFVVSNSGHLGFNFWTLPPFNKSYDPNVTGEYQINLTVADALGTLASSTIFVNVVPEPATLGLVLMSGLFGAAVYLRRRWG